MVAHGGNRSHLHRRRFRSFIKHHPGRTPYHRPGQCSHLVRDRRSDAPGDASCAASLWDVRARLRFCGQWHRLVRLIPSQLAPRLAPRPLLRTRAALAIGGAAGGAARFRNSTFASQPEPCVKWRGSSHRKAPKGSNPSACNASTVVVQLGWLS